MPTPTEDILKINADKYYSRWNYPNCCAAIDGKHIRIVCPPNTGSLHFNYKSFFSSVLMAMVDADCKFLSIDVGAYGREGDAGVFRESVFGRQIASKSFNFPSPN